MPRVIPRVLKSSAVASVRIRALIHIGIMKSITVTALRFRSRLASIHAAGYPNNIHISVFSIATSMDSANVERASESVKKRVMLDSVKCPEPSWKAYSTIRTSGSTTNTSMKMRYGRLQ